MSPELKTLVKNNENIGESLNKEKSDIFSIGIVILKSLCKLKEK